MVINRDFIDRLKSDNVFISDIYNDIVKKISEPQTDKECEDFLFAYMDYDDIDRNKEKRDEYIEEAYEDDRYGDSPFSYVHDDDFYDELGYDEYPEMLFDDILRENYHVYIDENVKTYKLEFHNQEEHDEWYRTTPEYKEIQEQEEREQRIRNEINEKLPYVKDRTLFLSEPINYYNEYYLLRDALAETDVNLLVAPNRKNHYLLQPVLHKLVDDLGLGDYKPKIIRPPEWDINKPRGLLGYRNEEGSLFDTLENAELAAKMYAADINSNDRAANPLKRTMIECMKERGLAYIGQQEENGIEFDIRFFREGHREDGIPATDEDYMTFDRWSDIREWIHNHDEKLLRSYDSDHNMYDKMPESNVALRKKLEINSRLIPDNHVSHKDSGHEDPSGR